MKIFICIVLWMFSSSSEIQVSPQYLSQSTAMWVTQGYQRKSYQHCPGKEPWTFDTGGKSTNHYTTAAPSLSNSPEKANLGNLGHSTWFRGLIFLKTHKGGLMKIMFHYSKLHFMTNSKTEKVATTHLMYNAFLLTTFSYNSINFNSSFGTEIKTNQNLWLRANQSYFSVLSALVWVSMKSL